jgi:hypothetical protein
MTLYLYAPSPVLGGTETLAIRLAGELRARAVEISIVAAADGWLANEAAANGIATIAVDSFSALVPAAGDRVVASAKYQADAALGRWRTRTLFWLLHPLEFAWTRFPRIFGLYRHFDARGCGRFFAVSAPLRYARLRAEFMALAGQGRLLSMSDDCTDFTARFLGLEATLPVVPLPISARETPGAPDCLPTTEGFAYFGRIEQFKTASVRRLIDDLAASALPAERKSLVLFGYGADEAAVRAHADRRNVSLEITGPTTVPEVAARAQRQRLLPFAMGLSGLDLLLSGVPCVFLPVPSSLTDRAGNYAFLHQLPRGCVGAYPEFLDHEHSMNFTQVLKISTGPELLRALQLDLRRITDAHALPGIVDSLLAHVQTAAG